MRTLKTLLLFLLFSTTICGQSTFFTIDTHNDTAISINHPDGDYGVTKGQVTFPMMREGGLDAAFFAIYLEQLGRDSISLLAATEYAKNEIVLFKKYIKNSSNIAAQASSVSELLKNKRKGLRSVVFAIENGYAIGDKLSNVGLFYNMGVRAITLSHNGNNEICDASMDKEIEHNGLSKFGEDVVLEMNRLGIIIDISHASSETLIDVLALSKAPIMASHSGVYSIKNHKRNLKDDEIRAIASRGGVIQVATGRYFLSNKPKGEVGLEELADHIDYVKRLVGAEHIGIGTDFDGGGGVVGLENASKMKNLTEVLKRRGYTKRELKQFWGGNLLRVMRKVEHISEKRNSSKVA